MGTIVAILFLAVALVVLVYQICYSEVAVVNRKLKKETLKYLGDFKDFDIARFNGNVVFVDEPMIAPFSKRPCAFYFVKVLHHSNDSKRVVIEEAYKVRHLIQDEDYYAYINTINLKCHLVEDGNYSTSTSNDPPGHLQKFMSSHNFDSTTLLGFNKSLTYFESILEENESVSVYGQGIWKDAVELDLPEEYGTVLEITEPKGEYVYLSDYPGNTRGVAQKQFEHLKLYNARKESEQN